MRPNEYLDKNYPNMPKEEREKFKIYIREMEREGLLIPKREAKT